MCTIDNVVGNKGKYGFQYSRKYKGKDRGANALVEVSKLKLYSTSYSIYTHYIMMNIFCMQRHNPLRNSKSG